MKHRLPAHVRPERYKIMLKPDLEQFSFEGEETIDLFLEKSVKQISLHCVDLEIECEGAKIAYDEKQETVKLTFPKEIAAGKHQLKLKFKGTLNDKMRGFYRSKYGDRHLAVTQFESTPKMSTYLLAFIVGEFEYLEKGRVRVFTTPGKKEQAGFALDVAGKVLDFYEIGRAH